MNPNQQNQQPQPVQYSQAQPQANIPVPQNQAGQYSQAAPQAGQGYQQAPQPVAGQARGPAIQQPAKGPRVMNTGKRNRGKQGKEQMAQPSTNPNSTQNSLLMAEVRDGIVIMNDGSYRAVVMAQAINFDLMSPEEREAVEFSYQGFLNSLYFDIQIVMKSRRVDVRPYLEKLDKLRNEQNNMLLAYLMEDYIGYITYLSQETNIMDKQFFIVIPYVNEITANTAIKKSGNFMTSIFGKGSKKIKITEADLIAAKTELKNRTQAVVGSLVQMGIQAVPLDTEELIELYYDSYNPDTATRQHIKNYEDLTTQVVTKGTGQPPNQDGGGL